MSKYLVDYPVNMVITINWSVIDLYHIGKSVRIPFTSYFAPSKRIALDKDLESIEIKGEPNEILTCLRSILKNPIKIYDNGKVGYSPDEFYFGFDSRYIDKQYSQKYATKLGAQKSARRCKGAVKRLLKRMERFEG